MRKLDKIAEAFEKGTTTTISLNDSRFFEINQEFIQRIPEKGDCYGKFIKQESQITALTIYIKGRTLMFIRDSELIEKLEK
jgi:hypothetical protein